MTSPNSVSDSICVFMTITFASDVEHNKVHAKFGFELGVRFVLIT